ncbi:FtsX-like permease family protein [Streptomyces sp. 2224.1]|uniref:ABC transporter permease n=1 Tax=unclassified Streptomyces TaxID=2593676 RepID=UPI0008879484|nr:MULTISPECIES: ABC transporter permease [unclassified Streptomyces]PBC83665.1 FtsX-like permease family protein [Streptomyces sp. 2321.6]SDR40167.1 putative ABC transport system permease protein [Streptomyces sp. KS_16]SEB98545.1 FtsX-like permease family protein [Streptomyces sp. 2224.1]SED03942.1 FtsX-like permease family protein [Streptomyces sp. 2133.1]SEE72312.1 putative ABC transport system permease protein [Streptomyces sp. 2112.3]
MLFLLAWWSIRARKVSFAGSFVAMLCAQTLITACAVLLDAGHRAVPGQGGGDVVSFVVPFGFICLFVMAFAVSGAFALSVQQRTREVALLRAVAATPGQVRRLVAYEALVVTAVAAVPGCGLGLLLAVGLRAWLVAQGLILSALPLDFGPVSILIAVLICWVTAQASVWSSGRRASRVRAVQALGEASAPRRRVGVARTFLGLAVLTGGIWGLVSIRSAEISHAANTAGVMVLVLMSAVGLLAPWVGKLAGAVFGLLCQVLFPALGLLVKTNLSAGHRRLGAAATPLALTVAFAAVALFVPQMKWHEQAQQDRQRMVADRIVQGAGSGLPALAASTIRGAAGARTTIATTGSYVTVVADPESEQQGPGGIAQIVSDGPLDEVLDLGVVQGRIGGLGARDVALSEDLARRAHVRAGDEVRVTLEDNRVAKVRVAAVYSRSRGFGEAVLPQRLAAGHLYDRPLLLDAVYVRAQPGREQQLDDSLATLHRAKSSWRVLDRDAYRAEALRRQDASMTATYLLLVVVTVFTSISVVNTLVMTTMERSGEFALLRLVGATRRQVARMMRLENAVIVLTALLVGSLVAGAVLAMFSQVLTGSPRPRLEGATLALILGGAGVLALATGVSTTRIALRQRPSAALRGAE